MSQRHVTIVVHTDGDLNSRQYRVPLRVVQVGKAAAIGVAILAVLFFAFAGPISRNAGRVPGLEREVARLRAENSRVQELAVALNHAEANYQELRQILGAKAPPEPRSGGGRTTTGNASAAMRAVTVRATPPAAPPRYETGSSAPSHWPLNVPGFMTRGQVRARLGGGNGQGDGLRSRLWPVRPLAPSVGV
jgi:hypothetical protein